MSIENLASNLVHARQAEAEAKAVRIEAEEAILAQYSEIIGDVGSRTVKTYNGLKLTIKTSLGYKIDKGAELPDSVTKTVTKTELDAKAYEALRVSDPMEFSRIAKMVTTTPRKPSVTIAVL